MKLLSIYKAKVIEVIDGDTFKGEVDLGFDVQITRHFRVFGIDTPEIFRPTSDSERVRGILAKDRACELLLDKEVEEKHNGVDFICEPGQVVVSPVDGIVIRKAFPYADKEYAGVLLENDSLSLKMFYFVPDKKILGFKVKQGDRLGIAQDISKLYNSKVKRMIPHIHLQIETIDPMLLM